MSLKRHLVVLLGLALLGGVAYLAACGGGSSATVSQNTMGTVNTSLSDPPTCEAPNGPYSNVWVTIVDVKASTSSDPNAPDSGFVDLTPGLQPKQVDLLAMGGTQCLLATLGSNTQIPAGTYEQFRLILLANSQAGQVSNNQCSAASAANCVVLAADGSVHALLLSSEAQTGIKIPSSQITGGQFVVQAGQTADLLINFDACQSIVVQGNNQFRLKPVLHAGEVQATFSSIKGTVVVNGGTTPIPGGTTLVALEQPDSNHIDRVVMETTADPTTGTFTFCPVPDGTYDVVAVAIDGTGLAYAATVTTGVTQGTSIGNIPLVPETGTNTTQASLQGQVTTSTGSAATAADLTVSALQQITEGSNNVQVTIPLVQSGMSTATLTTASGGTCPANTDCVSYTLGVPAANPNVGAMGGPYTQASGTVNYSVDALAFVPQSGNTTDCNPSELTTSNNNANPPTALTVTAGATSNVATLAFTGCQ